MIHTADGRFGLPKAGSGVPTTHILKVPFHQEGADAGMEAAAARLALACGLDATVSEVMTIGGHAALLVPRFDRIVSPDGHVARLHQEDFAQALGLPPRLKYERYGAEGRRFDAAAIARVLAATAQPALAVLTFIRTTLFNLAIGNTDNHAKNHALLYDRGPSPRLAPLYDLLPIRLNARYTADFAFRIGAARSMDELTGGDIERFLADLGLRKASAIRSAARMARELITRLDIAAHNLGPSMKSFDDLIGHQSEQLVALMDLKIPMGERDHFQPAGGGWIAS